MLIKTKQYINKQLNKIGYSISRYTDPTKFDESLGEEFQKLYELCRPFTMTSKERMYSVYNSVKYLASKNIHGDFAECGVFKGGSSMMAALTLLKLGIKDRNLYLYDTYEGMPEPTGDDKNFLDNSEAIIEWVKYKDGEGNEMCRASLEEVKQNMYSTGYPKEKIIFVKGKVENTIPKILPNKIVLLRLDTDWYESTKHELDHLYPLLVNGGILIIDDYGHWAGAKKAVDEYLVKNNVQMLLNRVDYTCRLGIKN